MGFLSSLFGVGSRTPRTETVVQAQKLPEEISPFVKEILKEAQDLYKGEIGRGYDPYTGQMIAPLTGDEQQAMAGISGLVGTTKPFIEEALGTYRTGAEKFTPETAQEYMSPYQRAVTDIEKREAQTAFERTARPAFEKRAVDAGGMSGLGTRAGVEAAEMQRGQSQLLADIEAKGLQSAFQNAQAQFAQQKARERQMAGDVGRTGPALFQAGLAEQGALQTVGQQKRELAQSALDEAYGKFLEERSFPQQTLADYSGMVYGNPLARIPSRTTTTTGTPGAPGIGQQMLGLGLTGLNIYGAGTMGGTQGFNWGAAGKGMLGGAMRAKGGRLSGLSNLPVVRRQNSGGVWEDLEQIDVVEEVDKPLLKYPELGDKIRFPSEAEAKNIYPQLDPEKVEAMEEKSIGEIQDIYSSSEGREKELLDAYLKRKKELIGEEEYPFSNIQSAISAAMDEPTIAMGIIRGVEKAGKLTKADKKEIKLAELEMLGEEFGLEKEQLEKKERRALNIFERNSSLRKRLLSLPSELRDKVREKITFLKGNQIKDATIAKLIAEAEEKLKGDTKGYTMGIRGADLPVLLQTIKNPDTGISFMPGGREEQSLAGMAAKNEARKIIDEAAKKWGIGKKSGTVYAAQEAALNSDEGVRRIAAAVAAVSGGAGGTGGAGAGGTGSGAGGTGSGAGGTGVGSRASQVILNQLKQQYGGPF